MNFVFLFCTERSGSNLITSLMGGHSEISGPPPSHLFRLFGLNCHNYYPTSRDENWFAFKTDFIDSVEAMLGSWDSKISLDVLSAKCPNRKISEALEYLYSLELRKDEHISFVKENHAFLFVPFILANWPKSKFIFQVRDPRDVVASWIKTSATKGGIQEAVEVWRRDQSETIKVFRQLQSIERSAYVRYEDLILDPENTLCKLCAHIGVKFEISMLEFYKDERTRRNANRASAWKNIAIPVQPDNSGKYKGILSDIDIRYIELSCASLMRVFGYEFETDASSMSSEDAQLEAAQLISKLSIMEPPMTDSSDIEETRIKRLELINRVKLRSPAQ